MQRIELPYHEAGILTRLAGAEQPGFSPAAAEGILELGFSPADKDRMHALASKARDGKLTPGEQAEVEAYSRISSLLGILKSKARRVLKGRGANGKTKRH